MLIRLCVTNRGCFINPEAPEGDFLFHVPYSTFYIPCSYFPIPHLCMPSNYWSVSLKLTPNCFIGTSWQSCSKGKDLYTQIRYWRASSMCKCEIHVLRETACQFPRVKWTTITHSKHLISRSAMAVAKSQKVNLKSRFNYVTSSD